ncbi:MAG: patatin-like phospholipase family protein [Melioribacteraceae bacterium]|nr:patatin-like phospholipase family protein [Melioribacteraceae bacterium]
MLSLRLDGFEPLLPTAINTGQQVANYLNLLTLNAPINTVTNFDEFIYPFEAVSTNLITGEPHVLNNGSLSIAMRASSSVSLVLAPVKIDSLILVDGGLVANNPVSIAKRHNPDFILAVDATSPLRDDNEVKISLGNCGSACEYSHEGDQ